MTTPVDLPPAPRLEDEPAKSERRARRGVPPLVAYIGRRLAFALPLLFIVSLLTFIVVALMPGDPAARILGDTGNPEAYAAVNRELGLDQPLHIQYFRWISNLAKGSLGTSIFTHQPVIELLNQRVWTTLSLVLGALSLASVLGIAMGTFAALRHGAVRWLMDIVTWIGFALPAFWLGYLMVGLFASEWRLFPASGLVPFSQSPSEWFASLVLPVITLATPAATAIAKQTRDSMDRTLDQEYITDLRAGGVPERSVIFVHALRNAAIPIVTMIGLLFVGMLSGSVLVERVFFLPGLGGLIVDAAGSNDLPVIEGVVLYFAIIIVCVNMLIDLLYGWLDPRVRVK